MNNPSETQEQSGGCQCGAVRYKTTTHRARTIACHCSTCKQRTGAAYGIGLYFDEADIEITAEETTIGRYRFHSDTSGRWIENEFCKQCGTAFSWTLEMRPGLRAIAGGTYDNPHWYEIRAHIWTQSARTDMRYPDDVDLHERAST